MSDVSGRFSAHAVRMRDADMVTHEDLDTRRATSAYIKKAMSQPILERDHEQDLARRWREEGDERALHALVRPYARLAVSMAVRFRSYGLPVGDLIQEANIGLMQAAARFDPERDIRFSTYATWWIRASIQDFVLRNWSIVRTGTTSAQKSLFFNLRRLRARIGDGAAPMDPGLQNRIAAALQVPVRDVESMTLRLEGPDRSLNVPPGADMASDWQDLIADERPNPEDLVTGLHDAEIRSALLAEAMAALTPREHMIIQRRRLRDDGVTLETLGRELGVSKERVRQLENRALTKLRTEITRQVEVPSDLYGDV